MVVIILYPKKISLYDDTSLHLPEEAEFTLKLSRGKLRLPPLNLFDLSQYYYAFFKSRLKKCCTKIFLEAFREIHEYTGYGFENIDKINRRLCNCFFKAFVQSTTITSIINHIKLNHMDNRQTKKKRLSSKQ